MTKAEFESQFVNKIICGAAEKVLPQMPAESVSCCISSPPFWALRDYGVDGQLGLEPTFEEYIDKLCGIYDEVKRVLRNDGTCFVNLGDTYNAGRSGGWAGGKHGMNKPENSPNQSGVNARNIPTKSLCLIPQRFAIGMVARGWILRNVIIWHKPNPMPSSAKDRFTVDFDYVYFFVKSKKYWFEPQYEPQSETKLVDHRGRTEGHAWSNDPSLQRGAERTFYLNPLGRNKRCVWTIPTQPTSRRSSQRRHFATFPEKLIEPMIEAGCPKYACEKCGKPRKKVYKPTMIVKRTGIYKGKYRGKDKQLAGSRIQMLAKSGRELGLPHDNTVVPKKCKGYTDCGCGAGWTPGVVLDPFAVRAQPARLLPSLNETMWGLN
jgi:DNA modification methylase